MSLQIKYFLISCIYFTPQQTSHNVLNVVFGCYESKWVNTTPWLFEYDYVLWYTWHSRCLALPARDLTLIRWFTLSFYCFASQIYSKPLQWHFKVMQHSLREHLHTSSTGNWPWKTRDMNWCLINDAFVLILSSLSPSRAEPQYLRKVVPGDGAFTSSILTLHTEYRRLAGLWFRLLRVPARFPNFQPYSINIRDL